MTPRALDRLLAGDRTPCTRSQLARWLSRQTEAAPLLAYLERLDGSDPSHLRRVGRHLRCFDVAVVEWLVRAEDGEALRALLANRHLGAMDRRGLARRWVDRFLEGEDGGVYARALEVYLEEGFSLGGALRGRLMARLERQDESLAPGADLVVGRTLKLLQSDPELREEEIDRLDELLPDLTWQRLLPDLVDHPGAGPAYWHGLVTQAEAAAADGAALIARALARSDRASRDPTVWAFLTTTDVLPLQELREMVARARGTDFVRLADDLVARNPGVALDVLEGLEAEQLRQLDAETLGPLLTSRERGLRERAIRLAAHCRPGDGKDS